MNYLLGILVLAIGVINLTIGIKGKTIGPNKHTLSKGFRWIYMIAGGFVIILGIMYLLGMLPR